MNGTYDKPKEIEKDLWVFPIVLPENSLKWLNCYVIKPELGRSLLIDTGFNEPECLDALLHGMEDLGLKPENTDLFCTHIHSDHMGNAAILREMGCRVLMCKTDYDYMCSLKEKTASLPRREQLEGSPVEVLGQLLDQFVPGVHKGILSVTETLNDGDHIRYGSYDLKCVHTPGHTPGHMCLYDENKQIIFLGDHILFDISPNISAWDGVNDSLADYINSLKLVNRLPVRLALPAHRTVGKISLEQRIAELLKHHENRLKEVLTVVNENDGLNAYQIMQKMTWNIHAVSWEDAVPVQKWGALKETLAHLDYLVNQEKIKRISSDNAVVYSAH